MNARTGKMLNNNENCLERDKKSAIFSSTNFRLAEHNFFFSNWLDWDNTLNKLKS